MTVRLDSQRPCLTVADAQVLADVQAVLKPSRHVVRTARRPRETVQHSLSEGRTSCRKNSMNFAKTSQALQVLLEWFDTSEQTERLVMGTVIFNTRSILESSHASFEDLIDGMMEAFNLRGATRRQFHLHESEDADVCAVANDWSAVGDDLMQAIDGHAAAPRDRFATHAEA